MSEIVSLAERQRMRLTRHVQTIEKIVDGEVVKCVNIDLLPPSLVTHFVAVESEQEVARQS
jgi:hypothetical protein